MRVLVYKKKRRRRKFLIVVLIIAIAVVGLYLAFGKSQTDVFPEMILDVPMYTELVPEGNQARPGIERRIKYVVLHETGNFAYGADAASHSLYLSQNNESTTSWHYTVDENSIYHHIPDTEVAWHAGDSLTKDGGNMCGIGVEICVNKDGNFERAFDNAAKLTAYLVNAYHLSVKDIRQHADFISKNCPETIRNEGRMDEFINRVNDYLKELN